MEKNTNNNIGERILELRNRRGYTQEYLAERISSVPSYISNIERKNKCPSLTFLRRLVKELDTSFDYLLIDDFSMDKRLEIKYNDLFKEIEKLDDISREEFFKLSNELISSLKRMERYNKKG